MPENSYNHATKITAHVRFS